MSTHNMLFWRNKETILLIPPYLELQEKDRARTDIILEQISIWKKKFQSLFF